MNARDFCYWLQGYFEVSAGRGFHDLDAAQVEIVRKHLSLVFATDIAPKKDDDAVKQALDGNHRGVPTAPWFQDVPVFC